jgi:hypothetical protein
MHARSIAMQELTRMSVSEKKVTTKGEYLTKKVDTQSGVRHSCITTAIIPEAQPIMQSNFPLSIISTFISSKNN